MAIMN